MKQADGVTTEWDSENPVNINVAPEYQVVQAQGYYEMRLQFRVGGKLQYTQWDKAQPLTRIERHELHSEGERNLVRMVETGNVRGALELYRGAVQMQQWTVGMGMGMGINEC